MEFGWLRLKDICLISAFTIIGAFLILFAFVTRSDWRYFYQDFTEDVVPIRKLELIKEWPLTDATIGKAIKGELPESAYVKVDLYDDEGALKQTGDINREIRQHLVGDVSGIDFDKQRFAYRIPLDRNRVRRLDRPMLTFHGSWSAYEIYADGTKLARFGRRIPDLHQIHLPGNTSPLLMVFDNSYSAVLAGVDFRYTLAIRSEEAAAKSVARNVIAAVAPRYVSTVAFLIIGVLGLTLGFSSPRFLDIWAFAAFCVSWGMYVWMHTPAYYIGRNTGNTRDPLSAVVPAFFVCASALMTLAFFRLEGRNFNLLEFSRIFKHPRAAFVAQPLRFGFVIVVLCAVTVCALFFAGSVTLNDMQAAFGYLFFIVQVVALSVGFINLVRVRRKFLSEGLLAQATIVQRRIYVSVIYAVGTLVVAAAFLSFFRNMIVGTYSNDLTYIATVFPAVGMLVMLALSTQNASKVYAKLAPRLDQVDQEVIVFGEDALKRKYAGALFVFDVAGMRQLTIAEARHPALLGIVSKFLSFIEADITELLQKNQTTFRYKSNGDEFILLMYAKDATAAKELLVTLTKRWAEASEMLLTKWRAWLAVALGASLSQTDANNLADHIEMHVLACSLTDITITVKGAIDRPQSSPDFIDRRFTLLTTLFKESRHNNIAMYADDVVRVIANLKGKEAGYAPAGHTGDMGFLRLS